MKTEDHYLKFVRWGDEDAAYVVEVPELPGCLAHGATRQDAVRNTEDAIGLWIKTGQEDGLEIPKPRGRSVYVQRLPTP